MDVDVDAAEVDLFCTKVVVHCGKHWHMEAMAVSALWLWIVISSNNLCSPPAHLSSPMLPESPSTHGGKVGSNEGDALLGARYMNSLLLYHSLLGVGRRAKKRNPPATIATLVSSAGTHLDGITWLLLLLLGLTLPS